MTPSTSGGMSKNERRERLRQVQRDQSRRERRRTLFVWVPVALVLVSLVAGVVVGLRDASQERSASADLDAVKSYEAESDHVTEPVTYDQVPPAGGPHNPIWLNCGTYGSAVPNENAVHSMEHGATWVTYDPELPESQVKVLQEAMPASYGVLSPYPGLKNAVTVSAWGKQLVLDDVADPRLKGFISKYTQSPDAPEPGASCSGGSDGSLPLDTAAQTP